MSDDLQKQIDAIREQSIARSQERSNKTGATVDQERPASVCDERKGTSRAGRHLRLGSNQRQTVSANGRACLNGRWRESASHYFGTKWPDSGVAERNFGDARRVH